MPKVRFRKWAVIEIQRFIHGYEESFLILYRDGGLWGEDLIIENYHQAANDLNDRIFDAVAKRLKSAKVLGRKRLKNWYELTFHINARLIIVNYSEDKVNDVRWVEAVCIDRKPIIF